MFAQLGRQYLSVSFIILPLLVLLPAAAKAADPRAGTVDWPAGTSGVTVTITPAMPGTRYSVAVTVVGKLPGYSPLTVCTYFGITSKATNSFRVTHSRCNTGAAVNVDERLQLDWIVAEHTQ